MSVPACTIAKSFVDQAYAYSWLVWRDLLSLVLRLALLLLFLAFGLEVRGGVLSALLALLHHSYHVGFEFYELNLISFIVTFHFLDECCPLSIADDELWASAEDFLEILRADCIRIFR